LNENKHFRFSFCNSLFCSIWLTLPKNSFSFFRFIKVQSWNKTSFLKNQLYEQKQNVKNSYYSYILLMWSIVYAVLSFLLFSWVSVCWLLLCWVSLCWVSLCWVSLCWVSLCWVSWHLRLFLLCRIQCQLMQPAVGDQKYKSFYFCNWYCGSIS